jgi:hypothetical protein
MYKCVTTQVDSSLPDLFTSSSSPSHIDLCNFKVSVLVPLQWGHEILSCFQFSTYPHNSHMCTPFSIWAKSYNVAVFALDLKSAYEREHTVFSFLSLAKPHSEWCSPVPSIYLRKIRFHSSGLSSGASWLFLWLGYCLQCCKRRVCAGASGVTCVTFYLSKCTIFFILSDGIYSLVSL